MIFFGTLLFSLPLPPRHSVKAAVSEEATCGFLARRTLPQPDIDSVPVPGKESRKPRTTRTREHKLFLQVGKNSFTACVGVAYPLGAKAPVFAVPGWCVSPPPSSPSPSGLLIAHLRR